MSLTSAPHAIKAAILLAITTAACGPIIEQASFPMRPDTTTPGDLLGPYDGTITDGESEKPVSGALVVATWIFERGVGLVGPDGAVQRESETDADGKYSIARLENMPGGLSTRVTSFTLVVYKRGYVGYRSDRFFSDGARRTDFAQHGNLVRLERFGDEMSHARHLAFIGGPQPVRKAAAWEVELATAELEGTRKPGRRAPEPVALPPPMLDIWALLRDSDIRQATNFKGDFEEERLTDLPRTNFYDSHHFKAVGQPEKYDVALRVWRLPKAEAEAQYKKLLETLPEAKEQNEIATKSLRAGTEQILAIAWYDEPRGVVAQLTCGTSQCADHAATVKLGRIVEDRLDAWIGGRLAAPKPKTEEDVGEKPEEKPLQLKPPELKR
jgi:hypothetical protein